MKNIIIEVYERGLTYRKGRLFIDGRLIMTTLEPTDRALDDSMDEDLIKVKKVFGYTAIPYGTYQVSLGWSNKFKRVVPHILNVKGFKFIEIHEGNTSEDTDGCILVGMQTTSSNDYIGMSLTATKILNNYLRNGINEPINLTIKPL